MTDRSELLAEARKIANKGVAVDDGFAYSVPAADLAAYRDTINILVAALDAARPETESVDQQKLESEIERAQYEFEQEFFARAPDVTEAEWIAARLLAAGYCQPAPQYVTTLEELNFLPMLSVIRIKQGFTLERLAGGWYRAGITAPYTARGRWLPARVFAGGAV